MFLSKSCVLVAIETIIQEMEEENKRYFLETICSMELRLYRNIYHINLYRFLFCLFDFFFFFFLFVYFYFFL